MHQSFPLPVPGPDSQAFPGGGAFEILLLPRGQALMQTPWLTWELI